MELKQTLTQRAAAIVEAAGNVGFMPAGVRAALEGAAAFAADCALTIEQQAQSIRDLTEGAQHSFEKREELRVSVIDLEAKAGDLAERLAAEASTNAELLAKLGELAERIEALEAPAA